MGITDFDRLDIIAKSPDGGQRWIMVAGLGFPNEREAEMIVALMIKLAAHERHRPHAEGVVHIELVSVDEVPAPVLSFLAARGVSAWVGTDPRVPARGRPSAFELDDDGVPDIAALQQANARAFAEQHGLSFPPRMDALNRVDEVITNRRALADLDEADEDEELEDGSLMVLAGAYAGEAIRREVGGRWRYVSEQPGLQPVWLAAGPTADTSVNVLGKVRKALKFGAGDSVASLGSVVVDMIRRG